MAHSKDLIDSIEAISEESELTLEERIDKLGQDIIANAFFLITKNSKGLKTTDGENDEQAEMIKRFKEITGIYSTLKKANRINGSVNASFDKELLKKIKERKGSIGNIVISNTNAQQ